MLVHVAVILSFIIVLWLNIRQEDHFVFGLLVTTTPVGRDTSQLLRGRCHCAGVLCTWHGTKHAKGNMNYEFKHERNYIKMYF